MFVIEPAAAGYIKKRSQAIVITLKLEPAIGGCVCSGKNITGSYVPFIALGEPEQPAKYLVWHTDGVRVYYPANLQVKAGYSAIKVKCRRRLFWQWLELEGAKAIAVY